MLLTSFFSFPASLTVNLRDESPAALRRSTDRAAPFFTGQARKLIPWHLMLHFVVNFQLAKQCHCVTILCNFTPDLELCVVTLFCIPIANVVIPASLSC